MTRTEIQRGFGQHVAENSFTQKSEHVQLFTPIMLNRPPGGCHDIDPRYTRDATTMAKGLYDKDMGCGAVCWNVLAHLDFGVLSELDQVPFPRVHTDGSKVRSTLHSYLFPITPIELGEGFVIGTDRLVSKISGVFRSPMAKAATVYIYKDCLEVARTGTGGAFVPGVTISEDEVVVELPAEHQVVVVWNI
eukprot:SAG31_NODE_4482_length_3197_cov_2.463202_3_plen_191_part_00